MREYSFRSGSKVKGVDAQVAGERLVALERRCGRIQAMDVVEDARPADSPLHPAFCWEDSVAAERWREEQARALIRSIVVVSVEERIEKPTRAIVHVTVDDDGSYRSIVDVMREPDARASLLAQAMDDLRSWRAKYAMLRELAGVFAACDAALAERLAHAEEMAAHHPEIDVPGPE
jgi:hypothetical protein